MQLLWMFEGLTDTLRANAMGYNPWKTLAKFLLPALLCAFLFSIVATGLPQKIVWLIFFVATIIGQAIEAQTTPGVIFRNGLSGIFFAGVVRFITS
jgi:hypothetical protein